MVGGIESSIFLHEPHLEVPVYAPQDRSAREVLEAAQEFVYVPERLKYICAEHGDVSIIG